MSEASPILRHADECPYAWSLRRAACFRYCPRAVFLRYYGAHGGHDAAAATPEIRHIHLLKSLMGEEEYCRMLFIAELRALFYGESGEMFRRRRENPLTLLTGHAIRRCRRECADMIHGAFLSDHRKPVIAAFYYEDASLPGILRSTEERLRELLALPATRDLVETIFAVPPLQRVALEYPFHIQLNNLPLCGAPALAFRHPEGAVEFIEIQSRPQEPGTSDAAVLLHHYYAMVRLHLAPEAVRSSHFDCRAGTWAEIDPMALNFTAALDGIVRDMAQERLLLRDDGLAAECDFERNEEHCSDCYFREYCRKS